MTLTGIIILVALIAGLTTIGFTIVYFATTQKCPTCKKRVKPQPFIHVLCTRQRCPHCGYFWPYEGSTDDDDIFNPFW